MISVYTSVYGREDLRLFPEFLSMGNRPAFEQDTSESVGKAMSFPRQTAVIRSSETLSHGRVKDQRSLKR